MEQWISAYENAGASNRRILTTAIGGTLGLVDRFYDLYLCLESTIVLPPTVLAGEIRTTNRDERLSVHIGFALMLSVRHQLLSSAAALLQGHGIEAMIHNRRAIEFAVFILRMHAHPELSQKWLDAQEDYETYLASFSGRKKLFSGNDSAIKYLESAYDQTSKLMHGSIYSLGGSIIHGPLEGQKPRLDHFDIADNSERVVTLLFQIFFTHRAILAHLPSRFRKCLSKDGFKSVKTSFTEAKLLMEAERQRWLPFVTDHLSGETHPKKAISFTLKRLDQ